MWPFIEIDYTLHIIHRFLIRLTGIKWFVWLLFGVITYFDHGIYAITPLNIVFYATYGAFLFGCLGAIQAVFQGCLFKFATKRVFLSVYWPILVVGEAIQFVGIFADAFLFNLSGRHLAPLGTLKTSVIADSHLLMLMMAGVIAMLTAVCCIGVAKLYDLEKQKEINSDTSGSPLKKAAISCVLSCLLIGSFEGAYWRVTGSLYKPILALENPRYMLPPLFRAIELSDKRVQNKGVKPTYQWASETDDTYYIQPH